MKKYVDLTLDEERALYGEKGLWVRPASMWTEKVERDGYCGPRFQYIG